jgi:hypothetical protein
MKGQCPSCAHPFDSMTAITGDRLPITGDVTVCIECAQLLVFVVEQGRIDVRRPMPEEIADLPEYLMAEVARVKRALRTRAAHP